MRVRRRCAVPSCAYVSPAIEAYEARKRCARFVDFSPVATPGSHALILVAVLLAASCASAPVGGDPHDQCVMTRRCSAHTVTTMPELWFFIGLATGILIAGFSALGAFDRGVDSARRRPWLAELAARRDADRRVHERAMTIPLESVTTFKREASIAI